MMKTLQGVAVLGTEIAQAAYSEAVLLRPFGEPVHPESRLDFGDDKSLCLHLRRVGFSLGEDDDAYEYTPFGMYGGQQDGKFTVILKGIFFDLVGITTYDTLEDLKRDWELD